MKAYKILNILTKKHITAGSYKPKSSWRRWPEEAISNLRLKNPNFDNEHVVEEYKLVKTKTYKADKSSIN